MATAARAGARVERRLPVGAEPQRDGTTHFRVWAPRARLVEVELEAPRLRAALAPEPGGYFAGSAPAAAGSRYGVRLDGAEPVADPASRFQPEGPEGPSEVVDPGAYAWRDAGWPGLALEGQVLYELHVGTFTPEGSFEAAARRLPELAALGVTAVELMPLADFPGRFGWGYDGVCPFAPTRLYGRPDDLRRLVDRAHELGLGVLLDVVYNHLGPAGNALPRFSDDYLSAAVRTDWGPTIHYDGPASGPVRELFVANAGYWIDEFHLDGLRFDATQDVHDASGEHVLAAMARRAREAAGARRVLLVAENEPQDARLLRDPARGGLGFDAVWNDDFHHAALVALTGRREAYTSDYGGHARELLAAARWGYLYQGQPYRWQGKRRGTPALDARPAQFVHYLENHDQVANSARGRRRAEQGHPGDWRALTALLLLGPETPLLFQGQELDGAPPFLFFADAADPALRGSIQRGRRAFLAQFESLALPEVQAGLPDPCDPASFEACKLPPAEEARRGPSWRLIRDLLALRRREPAFRAQARERLEGAVLAERLLVLRFLGDEPEEDRLLALNLGPGCALDAASEPLLAPPLGRSWRTLWSSEDPRYGGGGSPPLETEQGWRFPPHAAWVLTPGGGDA
jgi:maltooligosyltrehalose trehalohydrolase